MTTAPSLTEPSRIHLGPIHLRFEPVKRVIADLGLGAESIIRFDTAEFRERSGRAPLGL